MGMRALMEDLGVGGVKLRLKSDASAAIGIASRRGLGKIRHLEVSQLWLQQKVANGDLEVIKVNGEDNLADALTKHLGAGDFAETHGGSWVGRARRQACNHARCCAGW